MSPPSLVVLAAGRGTRFGGPKQLVAVRDDGATITDVLIERAATAGIDASVVVVNDDVVDAMCSQLVRAGHAAEVVCQRGRRGTAEALMAAAELTDGPVVVVNADDLYPTVALELAAAHLAASATEHAVVGFPVARTLYGSKPQSRALLSIEAGMLAGVREGKVHLEADLCFVPRGAAGTAACETLRGDELVSMNLWALQRNVFDVVAAALGDDGDDEVYLPEVMGEMIAAGDEVRVLSCDAECRGITFPEDVATLGSLL